MKINWFSPLLPAKSDIAHYTSRILNHFEKNIELILWSDENNWSIDLEKKANIRWYDPNSLSLSEINQADINIYNIGNNALFHGSIWKVSQKYPGIVILHDINLHYLFTSLFPHYLESGVDQEAYKNLMVQFHGAMCHQDLEQFFHHQLDWGTMAERYPLTYAGLNQALGVIVHNQEAFKFLKQTQRLPVLYIPLPYPEQPIYSVSRKNQKRTHPYKLIIFGHLGGTHRRVQVFLEAFANFSEKFSFHLDIYGEIWDKEYISNLIKDFGLENLVTLHGFVEEPKLDAALAQADLVINLRYPTGGEASGSQLRIWSHALPTLVTQIGWYANLPKNVVAFVRHDHEIEDIQQHLQDFLANPDKFIEMGKRGKDILIREHSPLLYVDRVIKFAKAIKSDHINFEITQKPKVSVVILTYNSSKYLPQAIESILQQTYKNYEIIIVDNASIDDTQVALQPYDSRIRYTRYDQHQRTSVAYNRGIEMTRGDFVVFLHADHHLLPRQLEVQVTYFEKNNSLGLLCSGFRRVNQEQELLVDIEPWHEHPQLNCQTFLSSSIFLGGMMFSRNWLEWVGGFKTELDYAEDLDIVLRLTLINCPMDWLRQVGVCERLHHEKIKPNSPIIINEIEKTLALFFAQPDLPDEIVSLKNPSLYKVLVREAFDLYQLGKTSEMAALLKQSLLYTHQSRGEVISDWIEKFNCYSLQYGEKFNAYELSQMTDWKNLILAHIIRLE
jgi:glycosyltransferase involved in cell wall biosynthesis